MTDPHDPYVHPITRVLYNELGVLEAEELERRERDISAVRDVELVSRPAPGRFDLGHLRRIHRHLFRDVYAWAGELRIVNIAKGAPFARWEHLEQAGAQVFAALADEGHLCGLARQDFVVRLAHHLGDVNALHPFREGNGRTQRAFFRQLAAEAGYTLHWTRVGREENDQASLRSLAGDSSALCSLLDRIVEPCD